MSKLIITLTSDFGVQTQGIGLMEGVAYSIAPDVRLIHLMHGLPEFDITAAARTMESISYLPLGAHVCVCDPGVGTSRKAIVIETHRGDFLVGPDNGVLLPASRILGGIVRVHEITNPKYMRMPVSPIFHGRDIFAPTAAHLTSGVPIGEFGPELQADTLVPASYEEAQLCGDRIECKIIQINHFGSIHLNLLHEEWDRFDLSARSHLTLVSKGHEDISLSVCRTFGEVERGQDLILKDDYGRVEIATNMGSFVAKHSYSIGDQVALQL